MDEDLREIKWLGIQTSGGRIFGVKSQRKCLQAGFVRCV